jgi:hypothetical protein
MDRPIVEHPATIVKDLPARGEIFGDVKTR